MTQLRVVGHTRLTLATRKTGKTKKKLGPKCDATHGEARVLGSVVMHSSPSSPCGDVPADAREPAVSPLTVTTPASCRRPPAGQCLQSKNFVMVLETKPLPSGCLDPVRMDATLARTFQEDLPHSLFGVVETSQVLQGLPAHPVHHPEGRKTSALCVQ
ncbi:hypothetical protein V5799_022587 [Amblyomma americanum]|uniref:Uncharacterized protein n=1 Tax=Amblyomma americanum TaxID=6943 RepID=A0AAQ4FK29_AMBAM